MSILNKSHLIIKKKFTTKKNKKERTAVNKGHKIIWKLTDFNHFLSFFPSFFFSEFTTAKEDHVSRAVTEIFIIFQRFLFTSVKRQSSVNAIKRCKRLFESAIQHSELVLPFLDTVEEILSSLLPRFDSLCLFWECGHLKQKKKGGWETLSFCLPHSCCRVSRGNYDK